MATELTDRSLIEKKFESLISKSKKYIKTRNKDELATLKNETENLRERVKHTIDTLKNDHDLNYLTSLKLTLSIIENFTRSVELMEKLKSKTPIGNEFDTKQMLDILMPNIKCLIECENWRENLDPEKLESDYEFIESLEEQHKRVLLSYLIEDWHNMDEVITLLKIGEIYKNIAEKLVSLSLISSYVDKVEVKQ